MAPFFSRAPYFTGTPKWYHILRNALYEIRVGRGWPPTISVRSDAHGLPKKIAASNAQFGINPLFRIYCSFIEINCLYGLADKSDEKLEQ